MMRLCHLCMALGIAFGLSACAPSMRPAPLAAQPSLPATFDASANPMEGAQATASAPLAEGWWRLLGDPQLNALVEEALAHNSQLQSALVRVQEARAMAMVADAVQQPALDATLGSSTSRSLDSTGLHHTRTVQPGVQLSWEADLWGRIASQHRAAQSKVAATAADRDAVALSVVAATVQTWTALAALQEQLQITQSTAQARDRSLRLLQDQQGVGYTSQLPVAQAQAEVELAQQQLQALQWSLHRQENALNVLLGSAGRRFTATPQLQSWQLPPVPQALPSDLLARRPDIAHAQHVLASSDASMAAQRAAFLPQVRMGASLGSLMVNALDFDPVKVWSLGGSVLVPLFHAGRLQAQLDGVTAQRDQAAWAYHGAVLNAFAEVANALSGAQRLANQLQHAQQRASTLARNAAWAQDRFDAGYSSYLEVLDAQRNHHAAQLEVVRLQQQSVDNRVALYKALGGGWQPQP